MKKFQTNFQIRELPIHKIICGDCLKKMRQYLPDKCIDLLYLDPPFFSGRDHEVVWNDGTETRSFRDTFWYQKVCAECDFVLSPSFLFCPRCGTSTRNFKEIRTSNIQAYLNWLEPRLRECHRVLREDGSIYVHLDWHAAHHVRVLMDKIFGSENFQNELIWHYRGGGASRKRWGRKHDNIFFYSKSDNYFFNIEAVLDPISQQQLERYNYSDSKGRFAKIKGKKYYLPSGRIPTDVLEIPFVGSTSNERLGYPTQKPLELLKKIIAASSKPGDIVLDPFAGCSTTLVAAHLLKRRWIGIDISPTSCRVSLQRLIESNARLSIADLIDYPVDEEDLRNLSTQEIVNWVSTKMGLKSIKNNVGLTFKGLPVLIAPKFVDSSEIRRFANSIKQDFTLVSFEFKDDVLEEIKNLENEHHFQISIKKISDLFEA